MVKNMENKKLENTSLDQLTAAFFGIFDNTGGRVPDWAAIHDICLPQALIIKKSEAGEEVYNLETFIEPRRKILSDGTRTGFSDWETAGTTHIVGNIAQRSSKYRKKGLLNGQPWEGSGNKIFQFVKTAAGWKIAAVVWEDEA